MSARGQSTMVAEMLAASNEEFAALSDVEEIDRALDEIIDADKELLDGFVEIGIDVYQQMHRSIYHCARVFDEAHEAETIEADLDEHKAALFAGRVINPTETQNEEVE